MKTLPTITFNGSFLELRNAALQLGGCKNWQKRQVIAAFGLGIAEMAMTLTHRELGAVKRLFVAYFESQFTELDKKMDLAIKKAEYRIINDLPYEDEEDI